MWGLFSTLAAAFVSLFSAANSANNQNRNIDKQLKAQSDENQKIREYNLQLAREQNQMNLDQWNRENEYNSPSAQMKRLQDAGLNPDMMMGGGISNTSVSSPQMTSGAPATPMDWSSLAGKRSIGDAVSQSLQNKLTQAQIDNINANTKKQGAETSILTDEASFKKSLLEGELKIQNGVIKINDATAAEKIQNVKESQQRCEFIQTQMSEVNATVQQIYNSIANDNARLDLEKAFSDANIKKLASSSNLDNVTAHKIVKELESILRQYQDNHAIAEQQVINLGREGKILLWNGQQAEFDARVSTYEGFTSDMTFYQNCTKFLAQALNLLTHFIPGATPMAK